jgi:hypothetical protein
MRFGKFVLFSEAVEKEYIWSLGKSPLNTRELRNMLMNYTDYESANILIDGFTYGFKINYTGPRTPVVCKKLESIYQYPDIALQKIQSEIEFGRIMGPFSNRPISYLRCSPIGIVSKKTGCLRLITHHSYPIGQGINAYIDPYFSTVQYSPFDNAINCVRHFAENWRKMLFVQNLILNQCLGFCLYTQVLLTC